MRSEAWRAVRVGALVVAGTLVLAVFIVRLSSGVGLWGGTASYKARFPTIQGLAEAAEVRYMGVTVGKVDAVDLAPDPQVNDIIVTFSVRSSVAPRIDRNVVAELKNRGPLGDKFLELRRPDVPPGEPLPEGSFIKAKAPVDLGQVVDQGGALLADIQSISSSLNVITTRLVAGEGVFGRLLKDKEFGDHVITDLEATIARIRQLVDASADGKNLLGVLVANQELAGRVAADLERTAANLSKISDRVAGGEGPAGQLLRDDSDLSLAIADFRASAANLRRVSEQLASPDGLLHRLTQDPEFADAVADDFRQTLHHVRSIAAKIDAGEGSAGMLVNDSHVYGGLNDIVRGVERSWFVRLILKRKQKKGFEARVERILAESPDPDAELLALMEEVLAEDRPNPPAPATVGPAVAPNTLRENVLAPRPEVP